MPEPEKGYDQHNFNDHHLLEYAPIVSWMMGIPAGSTPAVSRCHPSRNDRCEEGEVNCMSVSLSSVPETCGIRR